MTEELRLFLSLFSCFTALATGLSIIVIASDPNRKQQQPPQEH
jgi:hypothetical protein